MKKVKKTFYCIIESDILSEKEIFNKVKNLSIINISSHKFKTSIWFERSRDAINLLKIFPKLNFNTKLKIKW